MIRPGTTILKHTQPLSDAKLFATGSAKLFAVEKNSRDIIEIRKPATNTLSNSLLAESLVWRKRTFLLSIVGGRGDHRTGGWEAPTRTYSCFEDVAWADHNRPVGLSQPVRF
jgi:hypothetical protein